MIKGYVMASKMLVEKKLPVRFMYREKGKGEDSGWRFFSGLEEQEYVDDPENIGIYDVKTILEFDNSITPYLDSAAGIAFEREGETGTFSMNKDYRFAPEED